MTRKKKAALAVTRRPLIFVICIHYFNFFATRIKAVIATLALWRWFAMRLAKWINNHGGQRDD